MHNFIPEIGHKDAILSHLKEIRRQRFIVSEHYIVSARVRIISLFEPFGELLGKIAGAFDDLLWHLFILIGSGSLLAFGAFPGGGDVENILARRIHHLLVIIPHRVVV